MKILIIDDEIAALTKMKALLSAYGDCTMTTHAEQALRLFESALRDGSPYNLIALDIHLSEVSGLDILEALNAMEVESEAPRSIKIMVTASGTKANLIKAFTKGCNGFLVKPVKRDVLAEKMESMGFSPRQTDAPVPAGTASGAGSREEAVEGTGLGSDPRPLEPEPEQFNQ